MCFHIDWVCNTLLQNPQCYLSQSCLDWLCSADPSPSHSHSCTAAGLLSEQTHLLCTAGAHRHSSRSSWGGKHSPELASQTLLALSSLDSCCTWWQTTWGHTVERAVLTIPNVLCEWNVFNSHIVHCTSNPRIIRAAFIFWSSVPPSLWTLSSSWHKCSSHQIVFSLSHFVQFFPDIFHHCLQEHDCRIN